MINHWQLKDTAERIKAVDAAAALVEEMMKQGPPSVGVLQNGLVRSNNAFIASNDCLFFTYFILFYFNCSFPLREIFDSSLSICL